ncbi:tigger transposable element-derived protein 1-like [Palaemon carinicauda]|uniref:tigger transposable element-derived protein 1-like n=1 Tax=Palaemon carinicauda TaxID=392227 RepID=UPI0035B5EE95
MPGYKAAKDRLTLMLGANASGDCKLKPLLVYRAGNPRAFKNINKSTLPVIWISNLKAWVTLAIFQDWFNFHFIPEVKLYCHENNIPFKILLVLDSAPGHPPHLDDFHPDVQFVNDFTGFDQDDESQKILNKLVDLSKKLELDLEEEDFHELLEFLGEELSHEDLMELDEMQRQEDNENSEEEPPPVKKFDTKLLADAFSKIEEALSIFESQDPNVERFTKVSTSVHDAINCYNVIYDERKRKTKQTSLYKFFKARPTTPVQSPSSAPDSPDMPSTSGADDAPISANDDASDDNEEVSDDDELSPV